MLIRGKPLDQVVACLADYSHVSRRAAPLQTYLITRRGHGLPVARLFSDPREAARQLAFLAAGKSTIARLPLCASAIRIKNNIRVFFGPGEAGVTAKIAIRSAHRSGSLRQEIEARTRLRGRETQAFAVPRIVRHDSAGFAWLEEEFIAAAGDVAEDELVERFLLHGAAQIYSGFAKSAGVSESLPALGLTTDEVAAVLAGLSVNIRILDQQWTASFIHGDLSPANMIPAADGRLYLIDWELSAFAPIALDLKKIFRIDPRGVLRVIGGLAGPGDMTPEGQMLAALACELALLRKNGAARLSYLMSNRNKTHDQARRMMAAHEQWLAAAIEGLSSGAPVPPLTGSDVAVPAPACQSNGSHGDGSHLAKHLGDVAMKGRSLLLVGIDGQDATRIAGDGGASRAALVHANRRELVLDEAPAGHAALAVVHGAWDDVHRGIGDFEVIAASLRPPTVRDPIGAIHQLMALTKRNLVLELDCPRRGDGLAFVLSFVFRHLPAVWLARHGKPGRVMRRPFLFTAGAVERIFKFHTTLFEPDLLIQRHGDRLIAAARRRRVGNLVVVAGPSSSGKSTFATRLAKDAELRRRFAMAGGWRHIRGRDVAQLPAGEIENLIVELDLMAVETGDIASFGDIPQFQILRAAERVKVLTLLPVHPPGAIRMSEDEISRLAGKCGALGADLADFYRHHGNGGMVRQLYEAWFEWAEARGAREQWLVVNDFSDFTARPVSEFPAAFAQALAR